MMEALEYWLSVEFLRNEVRVTKVTEASSDHTFVVRFGERLDFSHMTPITELRLVDTLIHTAVAYWLNQSVFREPVVVCNVLELNRDGVFVVSFRSEEQPDAS